MSLNVREDELFKIALWSIRRLPTKHYKLTALRTLEKEFTPQEKEYEIIMDCIKRTQENGGF